MSDNPTLGFGKFVPGFEFLQSLAQGAVPQLPNLSNWVAPTLDVQELDKRIGELKAVHFWLDQNSKALGATIQALELQKMTLATLRGMNFDLGDIASALALKFPDSAAGARQPGEQAADAAQAASSRASAGKAGSSSASKSTGKSQKGDGKAAASVVDPLQWWGALTQQFQQIAADAMNDAARNTGLDARPMGTDMAKDAMKTATDLMRGVTPGSGAKPARKAGAAPTQAARKTRKPKPSSHR